MPMIASVMTNVFLRPMRSDIGLKMIVPSGRATYAMPKVATPAIAATVRSVDGRNKCVSVDVSAT